MTLKKQSSPRSLLLTACFIFFAMAIPTGILNVAWTYMQVTFNVPLDSLGVLLFAATCGSLIATFFSGRLIGRFGMGNYLTAGGVFLVIGLLGYTLAPSWLALIAAAFVTMFGFSIFNAGLNTFVSANYSTGQLNWMHAAYGLGATLGPSLVTLSVEHWGLTWHWSYGIMTLVMLGVTVGLLFTRDWWTLPGEALPTERRAVRVPIRETFRLPAVLLGMATFFIFSGVLSGTGQLANTLLTARGVEQAGFWISVYWGSFTVGRVIMGFIAHRIDNAHLIRICTIGSAVGAVLLFQSVSTALNLLGLAVIGLAAAPVYPTLIAETHRRVDLRNRTHAIGFQIAASGLGQALIPGAMAWAAARTGVGVIALFTLVGALIALALNEVAARRQAVPVVV